ncbi:UDP-glucose dehydrogenase family protein [Inhella proteolytica]|uniref:UDP-glucose 6-dehydrogenase n=1 Tax=Inhella proteolytica TaxID=2795029 RepID=A0A931J553_9BURK|nr:UDP-glucose/GDP-mannose dehydrogenase family protein [Inhella proteolytica]MBH9576517.1 UDP-glucose/GDP-mannose dehydrogenase family protein [Inhella proteolytica]
MRVTIFGAGYVGLVTGACLAQMGNQVVCLDVDTGKVARLQAGDVPIHEPGLDKLIRANAAAKRLSFTTDAAAAVAHGKLIFIGVGTPPEEDGSADLQHVLAAARTIGQHMQDFKVVVDKSTVPVGTADRVRDAIAQSLRERGLALEFAVASNPEFLKEGAAVADFMKPDRIVIGAEDERAILLLRNLYAPFNRNHERVQLMDTRSAELTKYAANAMLATRISFMNEMALLAERVGADIEMVRRGIGSDPRIGTHFLYAGAGYGGSCFPKDVKALIHSGALQGVDLGVLRAVEAANERQKLVLVDKVLARLGADLTGRHLAVWGLAFKPNTDDMREAPARVVVRELLARGATLCAHDPVAMDEARRVFGAQAGLSYAASPEAALEGADALLILTEWATFRSPDFDLFKTALRQALVFDGRNLFDPRLLHLLGIEYHAIGRAAPAPLTVS